MSQPSGRDTSASCLQYRSCVQAKWRLLPRACSSPGTCVHFKWPFPDLPLRLGWPSSQACSILIPDPSKAHLHVSPCEKEDGQRAALPATSWRTVHRMTHSLAGWDPSSLPKETVSTVLWFCLVLNSQNLFLRLYPFLGDYAQMLSWHEDWLTMVCTS